MKSLAQVECRGERIAVLGDMLELGSESQVRHLGLGKKAARLRIDRLYLLGDEASHVREGALLGGMSAEQVIIGKNHRELARRLKEGMRRGDWILFKGSRGMQMERVLTALKETGV